MPLTVQEITNEGIKLGATFLNNFAVALITTGSVTPVAQQAFGVIPESVPVGAFSAVCFGAGAFLHVLARIHIGRIR